MPDTLTYLMRIHEADRSIYQEIEEALPSLARAVEAIADRIRAGGHWGYVGAGTSGRLAVLDAAELMPTFGVSNDFVITLLAGGQKALLVGVEGAEDDVASAIKDVQKNKFGENDVLVGIAASGTTPYTRAALKAAKENGCLTIGIVCKEGTPIAEEADLSIQLQTGPEILKGSTRMKAGTAQKMILTMLSSAVMHALGYVYRDEMISMRPTNAKLKARAARIMADTLELDRDEIQSLLESSSWDLPVALLRGRFNLTVDQATERLERFGGSVAAALEEEGDE